MNSKNLFGEYLKLVTRAQYAIGERGEMTEQTEQINACRLPETNEHRLKLADKVLQAAGQCLEYEISMEAHARKEKLEAAALKELKAIADKTPKALPGAGGYN
jgi:hypothetical protein